MKHAIALAAIVLLGAALRLPGMRWGLPDASHPTYSFHPDEAITVMTAGWLVDGAITPITFQFGGTLNATMLNAFRRIGAALAPILRGDNELANTMLTGRYFIALLSLLTIVITYEIGRVLFDANTGLLAALILALAPVHVFLVHNVRPDETATFIAALIVYLAALIYKADATRDRRFFVYSGLTLGAALAFRFPIASFGLSTLVAWWLRQPAAGFRDALLGLVDRRIGILAFTTVIGYCVASPHTFIHWRDVITGLQVTAQFETAAFPDAVGYGPGFYQYGWTQLQQGLGIPLHLLTLAALAYALLRRGPEYSLLLAASLPYFVMTTLVTWVVVRYTLPMVPVLAILLSAVAMNVMRTSQSWKKLGIATVAGALAWTLLADVAFARVVAGRDVHDDATEWIALNAPAGSGIATVRQFKNDVHLFPVIIGDYRLWALMSNETAAPMLASGEVDFLVLNESLYNNMERLGDLHPYEGVRIFRKAFLSAPYHLAAEFKHRVRFAGIDFSQSFTSQDYMILNPGIRIYRHD